MESPALENVRGCTKSKIKAAKKKKKASEMKEERLRALPDECEPGFSSCLLPPSLSLSLFLLEKTKGEKNCHDMIFSPPMTV